MNGQIEFRVWDLTHKQWVNNCAIEDDGTIFNTNSMMPELNCVVQFWTGFKDKNGKKIYEGDIVKVIEYEEDSCEYVHEYVAQVAYGDLQYPYSFVLLNKRFYRNSCLLSYCITFELEVIGNIYQHPELLKS